MHRKQVLLLHPKFWPVLWHTPLHVTKRILFVTGRKERVSGIIRQLRNPHFSMLEHLTELLPAKVPADEGAAEGGATLLLQPYSLFRIDSEARYRSSQSPESPV